MLRMVFLFFLFTLFHEISIANVHRVFGVCSIYWNQLSPFRFHMRRTDRSALLNYSHGEARSKMVYSNLCVFVYIYFNSAQGFCWCHYHRYTFWYLTVLFSFSSSSPSPWVIIPLPAQLNLLMAISLWANRLYLYTLFINITTTRGWLTDSEWASIM